MFSRILSGVLIGASVVLSLVLLFLAALSDPLVTISNVPSMTVAVASQTAPCATTAAVLATS